mgnify:CR=1 FL=1
MVERARTGIDATSKGTYELAALLAAHEELEVELAGLNTRVYLTPDEQFQRKRIQKRKLLLKDKIRVLSRQPD